MLKRNEQKAISLYNEVSKQKVMFAFRENLQNLRTEKKISL